MTFVLVVDDDPAICRTLAINLRARDYEVETAGDGRSALQIVHERLPDVVLLDLGLPDIDGIGVLTQLRAFSAVPVIVVSARSEPDDKVEALDLGADDFVTKPFSLEELFARIRVMTRRSGAEQPGLSLRVGDLSLDVADSRATRAGEEIHLTPIEWKIVAALARKHGRLVRQSELLRAVWGPGYERQTNYLRVHLASIRRKLESDPAHPRLFVTEPGIGYRFTADV
ncbi:response regulator [Aeromicrobium sp. 636]|uniref:Response regulator transcription factor n=1 Tax=Aeromicrobium senzhongii TaxID=2663859 RepID=A0A8I0K246_9ACTN|nr:MULTISPECIES: response regulator transcription factor [Aeromicrobium]MBC9225325.1 response regulator transcription factor [Aeromicrobium senzhongii]MCQ3997435.1 response regulator [Aeromicrobium sp. 636]MTB87365.1 response regulator [Aeromicrobium senzhongii]QNL95576.1 response regulator transcription factor [Aeromicrobium senzhongii]